MDSWYEGLFTLHLGMQHTLVKPIHYSGNLMLFWQTFTGLLLGLIKLHIARISFRNKERYILSR